MFFIVLSIILLGVFAYFASRYIRKRHPEQVANSTEIDDECCGAHTICEKDSLMVAVSKDIEYYADHELDSFRGLDPEGYSSETISAFEDVFYTLKSDEVAGWLRSIQLRGINLPSHIKDEALLVVSERRIHN